MKSILKKNQIFILICTIYLIIGLSLIFYNPYTYSFDSLSYISIANNYFQGHYDVAINKYWGPLFSWMLVPLMYVFGNTPPHSLFAAKILSLIAGLFTLNGFYLLFIRFRIDAKIGYTSLLSLIPGIIYFSFLWVTPDLLLTCILIFYLVFILSNDYPNKTKFAILCGLLGGLAYLAKGYGFAFFIISFIGLNLIFFLKMRFKRRKILKNTLVGFGVFFIISGMWVGIMSSNYGYLTIGSSAQFNIEITNGKTLGTSMDVNGLSDLPSQYAISFWEDPSIFQPKVVERQPIDWIVHRLNVIWNNFFIFLGFIEAFSLFSTVIILASIIYFFRTSVMEVKNDLTYLLLIIFIFSSGYILIFLEFRYLLFDCFIILLLGSYLLNALFNKYSLSNIMKNGILIFFAISFIITPAINTSLNLNDGVEVYDLIPYLEKYGVEGNLASSNPRPENYDPQLISYYLNGHYYGLTKQNESINDLDKELKSKNIDYYLVWQYPNNPIVNLPYPEVTGGEIKFLRVYRVN